MVGHELSPLCRFRERLMVGIGPRCFQRFIKHGEEYVDAVTVEAYLREEGKVLSIKDFLPTRRDNSGVRQCFCLIEVRDLMKYCTPSAYAPNQYSLGIDLPEFVFEDPTFQEIYWAGVDLICWENVRLLVLCYHRAY